MSPVTNGRLLVGRVCALVYTCLIPLSTLSICRIKEGVIVKNDFEMVWNVIGKDDKALELGGVGWHRGVLQVGQMLLLYPVIP